MKLIVADLPVLGRYVSREFYFIIQELIERYGWRQITSWQLRQHSGGLKAMLSAALGEIPDVILFWEEYEFVSHHAGEALRLDSHKCIFADDLHAWQETARQKNLISYLACDTILATYADVFDRFYPNVSRLRKLVWVPHAASSHFTMALNPEAENAILLSGKINEVYPLRQQMRLLFHTDDGYKIVYHEHPGHHCDFNYDTNQSIGTRYGRLINRYRAAFTDCSTFRYALAKHFEIPATGALLIASGASSEALGGLGFVDGEHYVSVSSGDLEETLRFVLDEKNHPYLDRIRRCGQELVWERHKTGDRAKLIDEVCSASGTRSARI
jgi:hypothetical protein